MRRLLPILCVLWSGLAVAAGPYYLDLDNGTDAHAGTKEGNYTAEASTDNTNTYVTKDVLVGDGNADDTYNGDYIYNVTRSLGALITDFDYDDGAGHSILVHGAIVGNVDTDTFYILRSWLTLSKAATTLAAGEICYVRANTSEVIGASVSFTNDGTPSAPISIVGCDATTNDPWDDDSDVLPLIDFNGGAYRLSIIVDDWWFLTRLHLFNSHSTSGSIYVDQSGGLKVSSCKIEDSYYFGIFAQNGGVVACIDCTFLNSGEGGSGYGSLWIGAGYFYAFNCTFDPFGADRRIQTGGSSGGYIVLEQCTLSGAYSGIYPGGQVPVILRNTIFSGVTFPVLTEANKT